MRTSVKILIAVAIVLTGIRAALPSIVKSKMNDKLAEVEGWDASVGDVDLAVLRGGLVLRDIRAEGEDSSVRASVARVAVNISWTALLRRRLVASVDVSRPKASMTVRRADKEKAKEAKEKAALPDLTSLFPFRIDRFAVHDGEITVKEDDREVKMTGMFLTVKGLTNMEKGARARGETGATIAKGTALLDFQFDPISSPPEFNVALAVKKIDLPMLNPLLRAQFGMDVERGTFELVSEATSTGGGFNGYVKPFIGDLKMGPNGGKKKTAAKAVKEAVVGAVAAVFKNPKTDAVAAKVPFEGKFDDPKIGIWKALVSVLHNAFVKALTPTFDR